MNTREVLLTLVVTSLKTIEHDEAIAPTTILDASVCPFAGDVAVACRHVLFTTYGGCDHHNLAVLANHGFNVVADRRDGWGWLVGRIRTNKGDILYG